MSGTVDSWRSEFGDSLRGARVLVTGATGFLGWRLCQVLALLGAKPTGVSRSASESTLPPGVESISLDLTCRESALRRLGGATYDLVYHLAGSGSGRTDRNLLMPMLEANLLVTVHLLDAMAAATCGRLVIVGSSEEPRPGSDQPPTSPYTAAKSGARSYALMFHILYGLPVVMLRLFLTYGPRQSRSKVVPYTICTLLAGENPALTSGTKVCDAIYIDDAIRGMLMAGTAGPIADGETFDLGSGTGLTVRDLVTETANLIETPGSLVLGKLSDRVEEIDSSADLTNTTAVLGWAPKWTTRDGLTETIRWYRQELTGDAIGQAL